MDHDIGEIQDMIDAVNEHGRNLSGWELDFMSSVTHQFKKLGEISERQEEKLEQIYREKT